MPRNRNLRICLARRNLRTLLSRTDKIRFFRTLYLLDRSWYDPSFQPPPNYDFPNGVWQGDFTNEASIYPWELETLANELLNVRHRPGRRIATAQSWGLTRQLVNLLRNIENEEYTPGDDMIFRAFDRIGYRQFRWQPQNWQGAEYVRAWSIYGTPELNTAFKNANGISVRKFMAIGILWNQLFNQNFTTRRLTAEPQVQISVEEIDAFIRMVSATLPTIEQDARTATAEANSIAYRRSALRPCPIIEISTGVNSSYIRPIELLLKWRISTGMYYDVIADATVRDGNLIGTAFENYFRDLLSAKFVEMQIDGDIPYGPPGRQKRSPDVLVVQNDKVRIIAECKSHKLPIGVQLLLEDTPERERVIEDIANGVKQVCQFAQLLRTGSAYFSFRLDERAVCAVVMLDDVLFLERGLKSAIRCRAKILLEQSGTIHDVSLVDRVVLCTADEFEKLLTVFEKEATFDVVELSHTDQHRGSALGSVMASHSDGRLNNPENPLKNRIEEFLSPERLSNG